MADPKTLPFGRMIVQIESAPGSGQFVAPCGFLKKSFKQTSQTSDTVVPDCDDPDLPADLQRNVVSRSWEVQGSGVLAMENHQFWQTWKYNCDSRAVQVIMGGPGAAGGGIYQGNGLLSDFSIDSDRKSEGGRAQVSVTIQSDGAYSFTPNP